MQNQRLQKSRRITRTLVTTFKAVKARNYLQSNHDTGSTPFGGPMAVHVPLDNFFVEAEPVKHA